MIDTEKLPEHLRAAATERGFGHLPPLPNRYGGEEGIRVSESSNADYAGIWLRVEGLGEVPDVLVDVAANLTAETAWRLAEQLAILVATHYHGDQRPAPDQTVLRLELPMRDPEATPGDLPHIPNSWRLRKEPPRFATWNDGWHVLGLADDVRPGEKVMVAVHGDPEIEETEVLVGEVVADRTVRHTGDTEPTRYVIAAIAKEGR